MVGVSKATPRVLWRDRYDTQGADFGALQQQTGEIDNLIVSWEQSIWLCCV
jgi:hypothetical protein